MRNLNTGIEEPISVDENLHQLNPVIYGDYIAWESSEMDNWWPKNQDIILYDIETGDKINLTNDDIHVARNYSPAIYANKLVWSRASDFGMGGAGMWQIMIYDISLETSYVFKQSEEVALWNPDIFQDIIVWAEGTFYPEPKFNIKLFNPSDGSEQYIDNNDYHQASPCIYYPWVVWEDYRPINGIEQKPKIYTYNIQTGAKVKLVDFSAEDGLARIPAIYGNRVVYYGNETSGDSVEYDIFLRLVSDVGGGNIKITIADGQQSTPDIWDDYIVWEDWREGYSQPPMIYGFKLN